MSASDKLARQASAHEGAAPKTIQLARGERILCVCPEHNSGPGWANPVVWVYVANSDGICREVGLQPDEQTPQMRALFAPGAAMMQALVDAVPVARQPSASR